MVANNRRYVQDRIYDVGSSIEFQHKSREIIGTIEEVNFSKDKFQKRVYYLVLTETGETHNVDGELYQTI